MVHSLGFVISVQGINMEEKGIQTVKTWPELKSIRDIHVFLRFANFYWYFIQRFSKIVAPLKSMLKTTTSSPTDTERTSKALSNSNILTPKAKLAFLRLRQAFTEASILYHFDSERCIRIKTDTSG